MSDENPACRQTDPMDPARAEALLRTLGRDGDIRAGDALPPFFHQVYFWDALTSALLGRDGHPRVGQGLIPDMGLPRRMWAGGALAFHAPLRAGIAAEKLSSVLKAERKTGRTGPLGFVTLEHQIWQEDTLCVTDRQDLVYREDPDPTAPTPEPPLANTDEDSAIDVQFDSTTLFRYSALTFNGHRIHYDLDYAKQVEGYGGLVVHGPLLAQLLMLMADTPAAPLRSFAFRATAPLMHFETATLCRKGDQGWVRAPDGRQCMIARINGG
ncbi:acyl dehydratase [Mesobacterium sp. TK19101]|uniref:Acyl dehydratase n=1 Tax=Mesobacterium hydrothermale TaxID=3111907 RepID=A0ABU6HHR7_9RHOB|nr:acyl dehydratase [Mesobacterium sp. TK19101]MEC3860675.1 acyl dehydratase [Mesobacterium sp. TK19101]